MNVKRVDGIQPTSPEGVQAVETNSINSDTVQEPLPYDIDEPLLGSEGIDWPAMSEASELPSASWADGYMDPEPEEEDPLTSEQIVD